MKIQLAVRQFALPCPRSGSIETHSGYSAPQMGQEIHQMIQARRVEEVPGYEPEKKLSMVFTRKPYTFIVSGRADGVVEDGEEDLIEEIKSAFDIYDLKNKLEANPDHPYIWQLRTYGYMHYRDTGKIPSLRMHLVSSRNMQSVDVDFSLDLESYEEWLQKRLDELVVETKIKEKLFKKRQKLGGSLAFPFAAPRKGQKELVETVARNFTEDKSLLIQAPTGLGKTAGILYPSLQEALARGQKVIYVTPKNSQHAVAEEAVDRMQEKGQSIRSLTITAKSKMCMKAEALCNPKYCEFAKDYYKKVSDNDLINKLSKVRSLSSRKLKALAEEFEVCPFELSVEAIERVDVVIADYNYVFSPRSLLARLTEPLLEAKEKANLVIDEAHNLPSRAQDYFSPSLSVQQLKEFERSSARLPLRFSARYDKLLQKALALIQGFGELDAKSRKVEIDPVPFFDLDRELKELLTSYLESDVEILPQDPVLKFSNTWGDFAQSLLLAGDEFFQTYQNSYNNEMLKITCCDASKHLQTVYEEFKNVVAFSATLKPFEYYQKMLGFSEVSTEKKEFSSPFPPEHQKILLIPQVSTKLNDRAVSTPQIAQVIKKVMDLRRGNYLALFPSFEFMRMVRTELQGTDFEIIEQSREMKTPAIEAVLNELRTNDRPLLLLGVQGGVFSEGVDFPGDMLIGAFVVGPALPQFDFEREQIKAYYEKIYGKDKAFDYTYVYPAMAKAIQSAGRVIRSEEDRGVIVLMDPRFLQKSYAETMPQSWFANSAQELVSQQILTDLRSFWMSAVKQDENLPKKDETLEV